MAAKKDFTASTEKVLSQIEIATGTTQEADTTQEVKKTQEKKTTRKTAAKASKPAKTSGKTRKTYTEAEALEAQENLKSAKITQTK